MIMAMTGNIRSLRPARAAIAAVLAFSSPPLLAQTIVPPSQPVIVNPAAEPEQPPASSAPAFAPAQPVVQSTPSVEQRLDAAIAASQAEEKAQTAVAAPVERRAPRPATRTAARTEPVASPQRATAPVQSEAPVPAPVQAAAPPAAAAPVRPAPVPPSQAGIDPALLWALGGGSLLMAGLAGAALLRRRKRREEQWEGEEHWEGEVIQPMPAEPAPAMPLMTPPPAIAPARSEEESSLEAMVAAPPSPENPFRTHAKRMTRAKFLLAQRQKQAATPAAEETMAAPPVSARPAPAATQTVYRFGSDRRRDSVFKPRTS